MGEISLKTGNNARNGEKNGLNRLIRGVYGRTIGPDPRNFNQRANLGRNAPLVRSFPLSFSRMVYPVSLSEVCMKSVAVIMSVYKLDDPIAFRDSLLSIINQTHPCDLFIFRDGDVPELIYDILDEFSSNATVRVFHSDENIGLANALNKLIEELLVYGYDYVARMDSDDISRPNRIALQVSYFENNPAVAVCGTSCREFGASYAKEEKHLPTTHAELLTFSISRCPFIHPSVMFRAEVFEAGYRYPTNTIFTEDMAFWFLLLNKGYKFGNLNDILLDYRLCEKTIERRMGLDKALSEIKLRLFNMIVLKQCTLKNTMLIFSRMVFHMMPSSLVKYAYKKMR